MIVHPPYNTDQEHWNRISPEKIKAPEWPALDDEDKVHPCDLQMTMKKGCAFAEQVCVPVVRKSVHKHARNT